MEPFDWLRSMIDKKKSSFKSLLPKKLDDKELYPYEEALDYALDSLNQEIRNIAITGSYGSGKSSVITSYLKKKRKFKWLDDLSSCSRLVGIRNIEWLNKFNNNTISISLATFKLKNKKNSDDKPATSTQDLQNIEFSILQQLIHQTHPNILVKSRFDRIITKHRLKTYFKSFIYSSMFLFIILCISFILNPQYMDIDYFIYLKPFFIILVITFLSFISIFFVNSGLFHKKDIQSIDLLKGQASFKNKNEQSVLNLFLDEILYFFEVTKCDLVIFEDLDRLEHKEIFIRLREINQIINNSNQITRPIKFIYAVKDDLFLDSDSRSKFFDFIIPIIPVLDFNNIYSLLEIELKRIFKDKRFCEFFESSKLFKDVASYINDMRVLTNIVNEYSIYLKKDNKLVNIDEDKNKNVRLEKIFALIVYKNLMPEDFGLVKDKKSILCNIVKDYKNGTLKKEINSRLNDQKNEIEDKLKLFYLVPNDIDELKCKIINLYFIPRGFLEYDIDLELNYNNKSQKYSKEIIINFFNEIEKIVSEDNHYKFNSIYFTIKGNNYSFNYYSNSDLKSILEFYEKEKIIIDGKNNTSIEYLKKELNKIEMNLERHYSLSEVLQGRNEIENDNWMQEYFTCSEVAADNNASVQNPIIIMLLEKGYIDQTYISYLSISHAGSYELIEFQGTLADNLDLAHSFDIELSNDDLKDFFKEEKSDYLKCQSILNYNLMVYLLRNDNENLNNFLDGVIINHYNDKIFRLNFINKFFDKLISKNESDYKLLIKKIIVKIFTRT